MPYDNGTLSPDQLALRAGVRRDPPLDVRDWLRLTPKGEAPALRVEAQGATRHRLLTPADLVDEPARPYVIKGLIAEGDHAIIMGLPGSGKSVLAPHMAYAVAQGRPVLGHRVKKGPVLYVAAEDPHGMRGRVRALMRRHGNAPNFYLFPTSVDLTNPADVAEIRAHIADIRPVLVVLDTVARAYPGLRENDPDGMGQVVKLTRELSGICNSAIVNIHHVAKDAGTTPRGHSNLNGDADITLLVEGKGAGVRKVSLGKNRSGPSDVTFAFRVDVERLGTDEDGDPIMVPVAGDADPAEAAKADRSNLSLKERGWLEDLTNAFADPAEVGEPVRRVCDASGLTRLTLTRAQVRKLFRQKGRFEAEPDANLTNRDREMMRATLNALKDKKKIGLSAELVWLL